MKCRELPDEFVQVERMQVRVLLSKLDMQIEVRICPAHLLTASRISAAGACFCTNSQAAAKS